MPDWIIEHATGGDIAGGILAGEVVAWQVIKWPPDDDEEDDYYDVGIWLKGDYRMVEPGQAPMTMSLSGGEYERMVTLLQYGKLMSPEDAPKDETRLARTRQARSRVPKAQKTNTANQEEEISENSKGDDQ